MAERTDALSIILGSDKANELIAKRVGQFEKSLANLLEGDLSIRASYTRFIEKELRLFRKEMSAKLEEYVSNDLKSIAGSGLNIDRKLFAAPDDPTMQESDSRPPSAVSSLEVEKSESKKIQ